MDCSNVLIVEDQKDTWEDLSEFFEPEIEQGILNLDFAATGEEGLEKVATKNYQTNMVIIDLILPDLPNELYFIEALDTKIKESQNQLMKGVLVSAHRSLKILKTIAQQKDWIVDAYTKPLNRKALRQAVQKTLGFSLEPQNLNAEPKINEKLLNEINAEAKEIKFKMRRSVSDIIDAGRSLQKIKKLLPHGYFKKWIETELECHYATAVNLMRVASVFGNLQGKLTNIDVATSVFYYLSTSSTPDAARNKVIELIEDGQSVSVAQAKKIVQKYKNSLSSSVSSTLNTTNDLPQTNASKSTAVNKLENLQTNTSKSTAVDKLEKPQTKQEILKVIPRKPEIISDPKFFQEPQKWQTLRNHLFFNGYPDSEVFLQKLPSSIALTLAFPNRADWSREKLIPPQTRSASIFYSPFKDLDLEALKLMITNVTEVCTEENEYVLFSFLPEPEWVLLVEALGCQAIVAEPNTEQYEKILFTLKRL
jgi:CheY-like chemotaxis protein